MTTLKNALAQAIEDRQANADYFVTLPAVRAIESPDGAEIESYSVSERRAVDACRAANAAGLMALKAIQIALRVAPADMSDKDFASRLATLSAVTAGDKGEATGFASFQQYVSTVRRCEKLNFDLQGFNGGINALQKALKVAADTVKAADTGLTLEQFQASKAAARAPKDDDKTRKALLKEAAKAADAGDSETAARVTETIRQHDEAKQPRRTADVELITELATERDAAVAAVADTQREAAVMATALDEAAATIASLTAENEALKAEVTRLQSLLAKRANKARTGTNG